MSRALLIIALLASSVSAGEIPTNMPGLMGLWHHNEGTGTTIRSEIPGSGVAAIGGTAAWLKGQPMDGALYFNTGYAYQMATKPGVNGTIILVCKIKGGSISQMAGLVDKLDGNTPNGAVWAHLLWANANGIWEAAIFDGSNRFLDTTAVSKLDKWYFTVWKWTSGKTYQIIVNGEVLYKGSIGTMRTAHTYWVFGRGGSGGPLSNYYVDEVALFNREITDGEARRLYTLWLGRIPQ